MAASFNVVLFAPEIPQNTGTIGRLCVCTDSTLHLIEPLGFELSESRLRRAGLDYWTHLAWNVHPDWTSFVQHERPERFFLLSSHARKSVYSTTFARGDWLVFGNETGGLPAWCHRQYGERMLQIPMPGTHARTHNLANAVSIVLYEALRQTLAW